MRNKYYVLAGIVLLATALFFGYVTSQTPAVAGDQMAAVHAADGKDGCSMCKPCAGRMDCGNCKCFAEGAAREVYDAYVRDTAGLRQQLADARNELNAALLARPVNEAAVAALVGRVNDLQGELYARTINMWVAVHKDLPAGQACVEGCECCQGNCKPAICAMMLSDQCPMKLMGCSIGKCDIPNCECGCADGAACTCKDKIAQKNCGSGGCR